METENQLAVRETGGELTAPRSPQADLASSALALPVEEASAALAEYDARRVNFRRWLLDHLKAGVHYGVVPGTEPKYDDEGRLLVWSKKKNGYVTIEKNSWQWRPSLYKAGAELLIDLHRLQVVFKTDIDAWRMMGEPKGVIVIRCYLHQKGAVAGALGVLVGEGVGSRMLGQKGGDENNSIKMAQKNAKVDAVINTFNLSDLFTQDIEDMENEFGPPRHENPERNRSAPKAAPRGRREPPPTRDECVAAFKEFCCFNTDPDEREGFRTFVAEVTNREFDPFINTNWTADEYRIVKAEIAKQSGEPE